MTAKSDERKAAEVRLAARASAETAQQIEAEIIAEQQRAERKAAAAAEAARKAALRIALGEQAEALTVTLSAAEAAAVELATRLKQSFAAIAKINEIARSLNCQDRLNKNETAHRISLRLSKLLSGVDKISQFGGFTLNLYMTPPGSWTQMEAAYAKWLPFEISKTEGTFSNGANGQS